jgi:hypothetical protein
MRESLESLLSKYSSRLSDLGLKLVARDKDPNYIFLTCNTCKNEFKRPMLSLKGGHAIRCSSCLEVALADQFLAAGWKLLGKCRIGDKKSRFETRVIRCISCGYLNYCTPSSLEDHLHCRECSRLTVQWLAQERGFTLVNQSRKSTALLSCKICNSEKEVQFSNLVRHGTSCVVCKGTSNKKSYVYAFLISYGDLNVVKVGKSNNPYLRHLGFGLPEDSTIEHIFSIGFENSKDALSFEKIIHKEFSDFRIDAKGLLLNGFTETYDPGILDRLREFVNAKDTKN